MFKKLALLTTTLLSFSQLHASDWFELSSDNERRHLVSLNYMNPIQPSYTSNPATEIEIWVKSVIHNDLTKDGMTVGDYAMTLYKLNCKNQQMGLKQYATYTSQGKNLNSHTLSYINMTSPIPETVGARILIGGCAALDIYNNPQKYT